MSTETFLFIDISALGYLIEYQKQVIQPAVQITCNKTPQQKSKTKITNFDLDIQLWVKG